MILTDQELQDYQRDGYYIGRGLFTPDEIVHLRAHYMRLREGQHPGDFVGIPRTNDDKPDPLQQYPRLIHMHRWDAISHQWLLDSRIADRLTALVGVKPFAVQTMLYFKPPGARGQALHQDQYYLKVQPGTCMAAWLALDDCDEANGCMQVVAGSHTWEILCAIPADPNRSFTDITVPLPDGIEPMPLLMQAGDVLFFNGSLVHGSFPNQTTDRFRRALIGHYIAGDAQQVAQFYHPILRMDGSPVELGVSVGGDSCGVWVDRNGQPVIEQARVAALNAPQHE